LSLRSADQQHLREVVCYTAPTILCSSGPAGETRAGPLRPKNTLQRRFMDHCRHRADTLSCLQPYNHHFAFILHPRLICV